MILFGNAMVVLVTCALLIFRGDGDVFGKCGVSGEGLEFVNEIEWYRLVCAPDHRPRSTQGCRGVVASMRRKEG